MWNSRTNPIVKWDVYTSNTQKKLSTYKKLILLNGHIFLSVLQTLCKYFGQINQIKWTDRTNTKMPLSPCVALSDGLFSTVYYLKFAFRRRKKLIDFYDVRQRSKHISKTAKAYPAWRWRKKQKAFTHQRNVYRFHGVYAISCKRNENPICVVFFFWKISLFCSVLDVGFFFFYHFYHIMFVLNIFVMRWVTIHERISIFFFLHRLS